MDAAMIISILQFLEANPTTATEINKIPGIGTLLGLLFPTTPTTSATSTTGTTTPDVASVLVRIAVALEAIEANTKK
jgi:hypothetical protein